MSAELRRDLTALQREIADAYSEAPLNSRAAQDSYRKLARDSKCRADALRVVLNVYETDAAEPYPTIEAMNVDIGTGRFIVSRANSVHPLWTVAQNVDFRIVHDVCGHYAAWRSAPGLGMAGFDWGGEVRACVEHVHLLDLPARAALMTECLGQTAFAILHGFDDLTQKVADLREPLWGLGRIDVDAALEGWDSA